ncbi:extracellular solute-binding protein [Paenibacillus sp. GCM10027626]|uniref:extracellular solute-binding protein n=1 Tax=Paenibacillus sp. GCM10027626 TaxID=3273411 RepID=UPI00363C9F91
MKPKFSIVALLIFVLMMGLIGCSQSGKSAEQNNQPAKQGEETEKPDGNSDEKSNEKLDEQPAIDMNGETIKISHWVDITPKAGTEVGDRMIAHQKMIEEKYNTKIEYITIPWGEETINKLTAAGLSGEPVADIVRLEVPWALGFMKSGIVQPLDNIFDFNDPKWPASLKQMGSFEGKVYGFSEDNMMNASGIFYNKAILEREGFPDLAELQKKGEWTWDKFLEIAKKTTKDTDGDGKNDQYGFAASANVLAKGLIYSNKGTIVETVDGKPTFTGTNENTLEALRFMGDLYNVHKVMKPNETNAWDDYITSFNTGKVAMTHGDIWEGADRKANMADDFGFVAFPKGPKADSYTNALVNINLWYMPANVKRAADVAHIWQELVLWDTLDTKHEEFAESNLKSEAEVEMALEMMKNPVPVLYGSYPNVDWQIHNAWTAITTGEQTAEVAMESIKQSVQGSIDEAMKK